MKEDKQHKLFIVNHIHDHSLYSEMLIIYYYLNKIDKADEMLQKLFLAEHVDQGYINMTNNNLSHFIPHLDKNNWSFYGKFKRYCAKHNVPQDIINKIDKVFIE